MEELKLVIDEQICRVCKSSQGGQLLIFGLSGAERNLPMKIQDCLPIKVSNQDGLPKTICTDCADKIEDYFTFRQQSIETESNLLQIYSSENNKSDSECSNITSKDKERTSTPLSVDTQSSTTPKKKPQGHAKLSEPQPDDYVLMKEETFAIDSAVKKSNVMADYLIEFNNNNKPKAENNELADLDIVNAMRRRREVLPPMWDVFERKGPDDEKFRASGSKNNKSDMKGKIAVTHRRYIVAKSAFPCSLCGRCFLFNQGRPREGIPYADADILPGENDSGSESPTEYQQRDDGLYTCPQCGKLFPRRSSLKRHQETTHSFTRRFVCKVCGKAFNRNEHLTRHMLLHNNPHPFQCDLCSKVFTRKEHLMKHKLTHNTEKYEEESAPTTPGYNFVDFEPTDDKPFVCDICHSCYARREHMAKHKKIAHGIECDPESEPKPYCCNHCFKTFTRKEHLTRHKKIHLREAFSGNYEIQDGVSPSELIAGPPGKIKEKVKGKDLMIPLTVNSKSVTITKMSPSTLVTPTKSAPQVSIVKPLAVTPISVNKDTVTLEISGAGAGGNDKSNDSLMSNIFKNGKYGEVSIMDMKREDTEDSQDMSNDYDESAFGGKTLTEEEKAQLAGFLAETSFGAIDFLGAAAVGGGGGGGGGSGYESKKSEDPDEPDFEKECIDMEDLKKMPKCRLCQKSFTKKNHLNRHLKRYHNLTKEQINTGKFEIYENGGEGENDDMDMEDFFDEDGNPILKRPRGSFPCNICKKTFTRKYHMYRHQKTQHGIEFPSREQQKADNMKCLHCLVQFNTIEELRKHECKALLDDPQLQQLQQQQLQQQLEEEEVPMVTPRELKRKPKNSFKCAICKLTFENHDGFKNHDCRPKKEEEKKEVKKGYKCEQCGMSFDKTRHLASHLETHVSAMQGLLSA